MRACTHTHTHSADVRVHIHSHTVNLFVYIYVHKEHHLCYRDRHLCLHVHTHTHNTQLMLMLANYVNSLESDKQKLKAQVKRLCSENNWLRQELTSHQCILQETEINLSKMREEKEQIEFLLDQEKKDRRGREQSPAMDMDRQDEEPEGCPMHIMKYLSSGLGLGLRPSDY